MTEQAIMAGVREVLRTRVGVQRELTLGTRLHDDLALDSLAQLTMVVELETYFRVRFEHGDEAEVTCISDLVALVRRRLAEQRAQP